MASFAENKELAVAVLRHNQKQSVYIEGNPGNGKTTLAVNIFDELGIPRENQVIFRPSLHDPVDLLGIPHVNGDGCTHWKTPYWLKQMQTGRWGLCIDELPQGIPMMQNALAGLILDRFIGECKLSDDVFIVATGNPVSAKAGASRMVTQLGNRLMHLQQESSLDGWTNWALDAGLPVWLISFLRFRPALLNDFEATRAQNPTERSWEMVGLLPELRDALMFNAVKGLVGEGAAAEAVGFKAIADKLPSVDAILLDPEKASVPTDPATLYALTGALAARAQKDTFDNMMSYVTRIPAEFQVLFCKDAVRMKPEVSGCREFIKWCAANAGVLI